MLQLIIIQEKYYLKKLNKLKFEIVSKEEEFDYIIMNNRAFWDEENKGFYYYDQNSEDLIVRAKEVYDGAIPVNLVSERVTSLSDGEIFGYITWGGRPGLAAAAREKESTAIMPQFGYLLTEEQRWHLVQYIRDQSR